METKQLFANKLRILASAAGSQITTEEALEKIGFYKDDMPNPQGVRSIWINQEIIDTIKGTGVELSGIRVYLAKHAKGEEATIILAPTFDNTNVHMDLAYFNYGDPCPSNCTGSIG